MNPNDIVKIKPTQSGWRDIVAHVDTFNDMMRTRNPSITVRISVPQADKDGYITGQFWCLMKYFDWQRGMAADLPFTDMQCCDEVARLKAEIARLNDDLVLAFVRLCVRHYRERRTNLKNQGADQ